MPTPSRTDAEHASLADIHEYWRAPSDGKNMPELYATERSERSAFLASVIRRHAPNPDAAILEIGCNAGRNLHHLRQEGFGNLHGIEISAPAVQVMRERYPELADVPVTLAPLESVAETFLRNEFDVIFTMAVLEHLHTESEWVFDHIARASRLLITIEDESTRSWRHFTRQYSEVFCRRGAAEIGTYRRVVGLNAAFVCRVFDTSGV